MPFLQDPYLTSAEVSALLALGLAVATILAAAAIILFLERFPL